MSIRRPFRCLVLALSLAWLDRVSAAAADLKPNIVLIVADDLGWKDVGFHGSDIKTPNLDRLAAGGTKFEQFYAMPMCTPSRAALLTGRYPFRYGLQTGVIPASQSYGVPLDEWLLPQALKEAGYNTLMVGKWHLGHGDRKLWPRQRGFDHHYGPLIIDWQRNNEVADEPGYSTTLLGNEAVKVLREQSDTKPFFLYLAFNAAHTPYQAPEEDQKPYAGISDPSRRAYAASITAMDTQVGRVVEELKEKGLRDNTLIVFMSDNGGTRNALFTGAIADVSNAQIPCDNGPYREGKGTNYEGGTRVVAFANWPGHIPAGSETKGMMNVVDWYATLAGLAGADSSKAKPQDSVDQWRAISSGEPSPRKEMVYNIEPFRASLRDGDWKLVWRVTLPQQIELFDLADDPSEQHNLAAAHPEIVAKLQKRIEELSAEAVQPELLKAGFQSILHEFHLPPAFPGEELDLAGEN